MSDDVVPEVSVATSAMILGFLSANDALDLNVALHRGSFALIFA